MNARASSNIEKESRWGSVRNILAVRLDNLGDVLMTTPALAAIKHTIPQARLTLLASPSGVGVARHIPGIDEVISFQAPWIKGGDSPSEAAKGGAALARMAETLASRRFDAAVIFTVCTQSALPAAMMCLMAGIPLRLAHCKENPYALLTDWVQDKEVVGDGMRHEVARQLALVREVGMRCADDRLQFHFDEEDAEEARRSLLAAGADPNRRYFIVHPGATAPSRRYPARKFGEAADLIVEHSGFQAVFTGSDSEKPLVEEARDQMSAPSFSVAGKLSLGALGALIHGAQAIVTNNSGPAHIAAALDTPVVDLYALTNPQHTPWRVASRVLYADVPCRNCLKSVCPEGHHECLRSVSVTQVASAGLELMGLGERFPATDEPIEWAPSFSIPEILRLTEAG